MEIPLGDGRASHRTGVCTGHLDAFTRRIQRTGHQGRELIAASQEKPERTGNQGEESTTASQEEQDRTGNQGRETNSGSEEELDRTRDQMQNLSLEEHPQVFFPYSLYRIQETERDAGRDAKTACHKMSFFEKTAVSSVYLNFPKENNDLTLVCITSSI